MEIAENRIVDETSLPRSSQNLLTILEKDSADYFGKETDIIHAKSIGKDI